MKRRTFLGTIGVGIATVAGCTTQAVTDDQPPSQTTTTPSDQPTTGETRNVTLGEGTLSEDGARSPHGIVLDNPTEETWRGHLVVRGPDDSAILDETYELESKSKVAVSLTDPLRYTAEASIPATGASETVTVELAWFDCNASSTSFTVQSDGHLESATISTEMACTNVETERVSAGEEKSRSLGDGSLSGDGDRKPHGVRITNPTDDSRTTRLVIVREKDVLLDGIYTLDAEAAVAVKLTDAADYRGTVSIPAEGTTESFDVESEQFDCNHSSTNVGIQSAGELDVETVSTLMACPTTERDRNR